MLQARGLATGLLLFGSELLKRELRLAWLVSAADPPAQFFFVPELKVTFHLAQCVFARVVSVRLMHFGVREFAAGISATALILCCSCEKHYVGEDPQYQTEHVNSAQGGTEGHSDSTKQEPPKTGVSPTPAEFFPATTPSP